MLTKNIEIENMSRTTSIRSNNNNKDLILTGSNCSPVGVLPSGQCISVVPHMETSKKYLLRSPLVKVDVNRQKIRSVPKEIKIGLTKRRPKDISSKKQLKKEKLKWKECLSTVRLELVDLRCHKLVKLLEEKRQLRMEVSCIRAEKQMQYQRLVMEMQELEEYYLQKLDQMEKKLRENHCKEVNELVNKLSCAQKETDDIKVVLGQRLHEENEEELRYQIENIHRQAKENQEQLEQERDSLAEKILQLNEEINCLNVENKELQNIRERFNEETTKLREKEELSNGAKLELEMCQNDFKEIQKKLEVEREELAEKVFALSQEVSNLNEECKCFQDALTESQEASKSLELVWKAEKDELLELLEAAKIREDVLNKQLDSRLQRRIDLELPSIPSIITQEEERSGTSIKNNRGGSIINETKINEGEENIESKEFKLKQISDSQSMQSSEPQDKAQSLKKNHLGNTRMLSSKPVRQKVTSRQRKNGKSTKRLSLLEPGPLPPIIEQVGDEVSVNTSMDSQATSSAKSSSENSVASSCSQTSKKRKKKGGLYSAFTAPKLKIKKSSNRL